MIIGDRLRALREEKKLSQGEIEKRTGLLRCYISRVENGHTVPGCIEGRSGPHSQDESGQPSLGSPAYPWAITETGHSGVTSCCRQVHASKSKTAIPNLAHVPQEPCKGLGVCRFLRGANHFVPHTVRFSDPES